MKAGEAVRCEATFKTGEAVGDVQCIRKPNHVHKHKAHAPWGAVHWQDKRGPKLSKPQRELLENADECTPPNDRAVRFDWSGVAVRGAQHRTASALCNLGLLEFVDYGRCEDDDNGDPEVPIYAITADGRSALAQFVNGKEKK